MANLQPNSEVCSTSWVRQVRPETESDPVDKLELRGRFSDGAAAAGNLPRE